MRKNINIFKRKSLQITYAQSISGAYDMLENTNAIFRDFQMLWIIKNKEIQ